MISLREIMSQNVVVVEGNETVQETAVLMADRKVSCVIVVQNDQPLGIVTETDITRLVVAKKLPHESPVSQIMTSPLIHASPETTIMDAAKYMTDNHIKKLPIVDGTLIVGMVTQTDVVRNLFNAIRKLEELYQEGSISQQDFFKKSSGILDRFGGVMHGQSKDWHMKCLKCGHVFLNTEVNGSLTHKTCPQCNSTSLEYLHAPAI